MKTIIFQKVLLSSVCTLLSMTGFAQKATLNEDFEGYRLSSASATVYSAGKQWVRSGDDINLQVVANPNKSGINTSEKVMKVNREENASITPENANGFTWRGMTSISYDLSKINVSTIEFKVLKKSAGKLAMRIFSDDNRQHMIELISPELPASNEWQTVKFDFKDRIEYPILSSAYLVVQVEKNSVPDASQASALTIYIDDVKLYESK